MCTRYTRTHVRVQLIACKYTVLIDIGEHPYLAEHVVGQLGQLHLLIGLRAGDLAVHRPDRLELAVELGAARSTPGRSFPPPDLHRPRPGMFGCL